MEKTEETKAALAVHIRSAYDRRDPVRLTCSTPGRAKQSFKDECDIHNIMKKFRQSGLITHVAKYQGEYGDMPSSTDYQESLNNVIAARDAFDSLPSYLRDRFGNDPSRFLDFIDNPENEAEMLKLGLIEKAPGASSPSSEEAATSNEESAPGAAEASSEA